MVMMMMMMMIVIIIIIIIIIIIDKSGTIQHITGACRSLTQGNHTHRHKKVANIVHQALAINCGLSKEKATPYYKYHPKSILENS